MKSDAQLQQDVMAELRWEPAVHAAQIGVEARTGVVTLSGEVGSYAEKLCAEQAAQRVADVQGLAVAMTVRLRADGLRSDADIAQSAANILSWSTPVPSDAVKVLVEHGWVTLSGQVDWQFQRQEAESSLRHVQGLTGINNAIVIKPVLQAAVVKADIDAALKRRASLDGHAISVTVDGGDVTLTGTVHSWSERELAAHAAWGTPGVRRVTDDMTLTR